MVTATTYTTDEASSDAVLIFQLTLWVVFSFDVRARSDIGTCPFVVMLVFGGSDDDGAVTSLKLTRSAFMLVAISLLVQL